MAIAIATQDPLATAPYFSSDPKYQDHFSLREDFMSETEDDMDAIAAEIEASQLHYAQKQQQQQQQQQQQRQQQQQQQSDMQHQKQLLQSSSPHQAGHEEVDDDHEYEDGDFDEDDNYSDGSSEESVLPDENIDFSLIYALHTFLATVEGQASVVKGDSLLLLDDANSYWWLVRVLKTEDVGYIPAENIETPFERLARLNKHRNIDLAIATHEEKQSSIVQGREKLKGLIAWKARGQRQESSGSGDMREREGRHVVFAPPTYVEHPGITWSSEEEGEGSEEEEEYDDDDDDNGTEDYVEEASSESSKSIQSGLYNAEPDDGIEWAQDAVQVQRRASSPATSPSHQAHLHSHPPPDRSPSPAEVTSALARSAPTPPPSRVSQHQPPAISETDSRPLLSQTPDVTLNPVPSTTTPPSVTSPTRSISTTVSSPPRRPPRRGPGPLRYPGALDLSRLITLVRRRAEVLPRRAPPSISKNPVTDEVQRIYYGERIEMDGIHPEIRSCFAHIQARMDAFDREVDDMLRSLLSLK